MSPAKIHLTTEGNLNARDKKKNAKEIFSMRKTVEQAERESMTGI